MIKIARSRVISQDEKLQDVKVVHIGDSPSDIEAAAGARVNCIGVATGIYDLNALEEVSARASNGSCTIVDDLEDTESILSVLFR